MINPKIAKYEKIVNFAITKTTQRNEKIVRGALNEVQKQQEMESSRTSFTLSKRRKTVDSKDLQELVLPLSSDIKLGNSRRRFLSNSGDKPITVSTSSNSAGDMCSSHGSGDDSSSASRCVSNESCDIVKHSSRFVDLEVRILKKKRNPARLFFYCLVDEKRNTKEKGYYHFALAF